MTQKVCLKSLFKLKKSENPSWVGALGLRVVYSSKKGLLLYIQSAGWWMLACLNMDAGQLMILWKMFYSLSWCSESVVICLHLFLCPWRLSAPPSHLSTGILNGIGLQGSSLHGNFLKEGQNFINVFIMWLNFYQISKHSLLSRAPGLKLWTNREQSNLLRLQYTRK